MTGVQTCALPISVSCLSRQNLNTVRLNTSLMHLSGHTASVERSPSASKVLVERYEGVQGEKGKRTEGTWLAVGGVK